MNPSSKHCDGVPKHRKSICFQGHVRNGTRSDGKFMRSFSDIPHDKTCQKNVVIEALTPDYLSLLAAKYSCPNTDHDLDPIFIVCVPGIDLDHAELQRHCKHVEVYEERQLYHLLLLKHPSVHLIYISSVPTNECFVRYLLTLRGQEDGSELRSQLERLYMLSPPLKTQDSAKLAEQVISDLNIVSFVDGIIHHDGPDNEAKKALGGISAFVGSEALTRLSRSLGIPLLEAPPEFSYWGTKQGSRELFRECGIRHPPGTPAIDDSDLLTEGSLDTEVKCPYKEAALRSLGSLALGLARQILVYENRPSRFLCKLNLGFSGKGNAMLDLSSLYPTEFITPDRSVIEALATEIEKLLPTMTILDPEQKWQGTASKPGYKDQITRLGVIAESFVEGKIIGSPSVQGVIGYGFCHIISTHEQILDHQIYKGCRFPASAIYRSTLIESGARVGNFLAKKGVTGHFSVDFVVVETPCIESSTKTQLECYALEINLRQGGTTHPFAILQLLTGGKTQTDGSFLTASGEERLYTATDTFYAPNLLGMTESTFLNAVIHFNEGFTWNQSTLRGVVIHMVKSITNCGIIGFTAIGCSIEDSQTLFDEATDFVNELH